MEKTMVISWPPSSRSVWRKVYRATLVTMRGIRMRGTVKDYYNGVVHNCARVSAANNILAFAVHRRGVFGGPVVEQIKRPDVVSLAETDGCAIIKDGYVYELRREER